MPQVRQSHSTGGVLRLAVRGVSATVPILPRHQLGVLEVWLGVLCWTVASHIPRSYRADRQGRLLRLAH
jgi:hypothetical protein